MDVLFYPTGHSPNRKLCTNLWKKSKSNLKYMMVSVQIKFGITLGLKSELSNIH